MTRKGVVLLAALVTLLLAACGGTETTTTTSSPPSTSSTTPETTTTTLEAGPQPLPAGGFLDPGEYFTTIFEPTVVYRIDRNHILSPFQSEFATGFQNLRPMAQPQPGIAPYRGVVIHNIWLGLDGQKAASELEDLDGVEIGESGPTEIGGYAGSQTDAVVKERTALWTGTTVQGTADGWFLQAGQKMRFIILDTPAGTLLITIDADAEEWVDFLPVAEEILAGISFPDMEGG